MSKTILITGSTDGIGLETARMLATLGHQVLLHGRNSGKLENAQHSLSSLSGGGRVTGFPYDATTFLAYYIAHDAHHRGQILLQARLLGHPVSQETMAGLWQWGKRSKE